MAVTEARIQLHTIEKQFTNLMVLCADFVADNRFPVVQPGYVNELGYISN